VPDLGIRARPVYREEPEDMGRKRPLISAVGHEGTVAPLELKVSNLIRDLSLDVGRGLPLCRRTAAQIARSIAAIALAP
jgi:hypothetical protein